MQSCEKLWLGSLLSHSFSSSNLVIVSYCFLCDFIIFSLHCGGTLANSVCLTVMNSLCWYVSSNVMPYIKAKYLHFGLISLKDIVKDLLWFIQMHLCKPKSFCHVLFSNNKVSPANFSEQVILVRSLTLTCNMLTKAYRLRCSSPFFLFNFSEHCRQRIFWEFHSWQYWQLSWIFYTYNFASVACANCQCAWQLLGVCKPNFANLSSATTLPDKPYWFSLVHKLSWTLTFNM